MGVQIATIANGETNSSAIPVKEYRVFAIEFPSAFTGTTVAIQGSDAKDGPYVTIADQDGSDISITRTVSRIVGLDAAALEIAAVDFIRIVSASSEGAERELRIHCK